MIYIRVDGDWYSTKYTKREQMTMYESGHAEIVYDSASNEVLAKEIWDHREGFLDGPPDAQIKLEFFLQGGKFHEWSMALHRFKSASTSDRMNENASFDN